MKKTAFMIVYNDADYVDYSIRSIKDFVDELIIVEGAFHITMATGRPARSDDGTLSIVKRHVDNKKVFLREVNLREHKDHYDVGYQWAISRGADWAILVDSDEVWTPEAWAVLDQALASNPPHEIQIREYCFINDFKTYYSGTYPRIFKCVAGSRFVYDNEVHFAGFARGAHPVNLLLGPRIFHYGYVRRKRRWEMKQRYMWEKDNNPALKTDYGLDAEGYRIPGDISVGPFEGDHPEVMKRHPFYGLSKEEIIYGAP